MRRDLFSQMRKLARASSLFTSFASVLLMGGAVWAQAGGGGGAAGGAGAATGGAGSASGGVGTGGAAPTGGVSPGLGSAVPTGPGLTPNAVNQPGAGGSPGIAGQAGSAGASGATGPAVSPTAPGIPGTTSPVNPSGQPLIPNVGTVGPQTPNLGAGNPTPRQTGQAVGANGANAAPNNLRSTLPGATAGSTTSGTANAGTATSALGTGTAMGSAASQQGAFGLTFAPDGTGVGGAAQNGATIDTPPTAEDIRTGNNAGLRISNVLANSLAAQTGFKSGDQIFSINGNPISSMVDLQTQLANGTAGQLSTIGVRRNGTVYSVQVDLSSLNSQFSGAGAQAGITGQGTATSSMQSPFDNQSLAGLFTDGSTALRIGSVGTNAFGRTFGLMTNDQVLAINGQPVNTQPELLQQLQTGNSNGMQLLVLRDGQVRMLTAAGAGGATSTTTGAGTAVGTGTVGGTSTVTPGLSGATTLSTASGASSSSTVTPGSSGSSPSRRGTVTGGVRSSTPR